MIDFTGAVQLGHVFFSDYLRLAPLTLLNFFAFTVVLICLLARTPSETNPLVRKLGAALDLVINNRLFTVIGSNSLLTFSGSVVLTYWITASRQMWAGLGSAALINAFLLVAVMAILYCAVLIDRKMRGRL